MKIITRSTMPLIEACQGNAFFVVTVILIMYLGFFEFAMMKLELAIWGETKNMFYEPLITCFVVIYACFAVHVCGMRNMLLAAKEKELEDQRIEKQSAKLRENVLAHFKIIEEKRASNGTQH